MSRSDHIEHVWTVVLLMETPPAYGELGPAPIQYGRLLPVVPSRALSALHDSDSADNQAKSEIDTAQSTFPGHRYHMRESSKSAIASARELNELRHLAGGNRVYLRNAILTSITIGPLRSVSCSRACG